MGEHRKARLNKPDAKVVPTNRLRKTMLHANWKQAIEHWRDLPADERLRRRIEATARHVANPMAMEGEPVDENWIRKRLASLICRGRFDPVSSEFHEFGEELAVRCERAG